MPDVGLVQSALLDWYAREARDLPWRRTRDPYAILVAEVMLQQTQVDRVVPIWRAWLERFPTLADLANATRGDALRAWGGLGYNTRAVRLHAIACQTMTEFGGVLPRSVDGLMQLKGIGRYTAGAVACFAYEQQVSMVDTNVRRVLSRVFSLAPSGVEKIADSVVPSKDAYAWNQALMDLGATLCRARQPLCLVCPLMAYCGGPRLATRKPQPKQGPFRTSNRFYRGRILARLRQLSPGEYVSFDELAERVDGRGDLIHALAKEGLLAVDDGRVSLAG